MRMHRLLSSAPLFSCLRACSSRPCECSDDPTIDAVVVSECFKDTALPWSQSGAVLSIMADYLNRPRCRKNLAVNQTRIVLVAF